VVVLGLGILWTLDNLGLANAGVILHWWPVLLVAFGLAKLTGLGTTRSPFLGTIALGFGLLLLAGRLGYVHVSFDLLWPLLLIVLGFNLVRRAMRAPQPDSPDATGDDSPHVSAFAMMGATRRRAYSQSLVSADVTAVMAGSELDLREAGLAGSSMVVDVFAMWGGVEIYVPVGWRVLVETTPIMGGVEDKTLPPESNGPAPTVILRGLVIMGGVEVSHVPDKERGTGGVRVGVVTRVRERDGSRSVHVSGPGVSLHVEKGVIAVDPDPGHGPQGPAPGGVPSSVPPPTEPR
jgi:predicted membrane protein